MDKTEKVRTSTVEAPIVTARWHIAAWLALWGFWGFVSRHNHPTLVIDAIATALLLAAFAADVVAIKTVYDIFWGPDPRRFGFGVNSGLEFAGMTLHLLFAAVVVRLLRRGLRGKTT